MDSTNAQGSALRIRGLSKAYRVGHIFQKRRPALKSLTLDVEQGEVFGYLGPNGSGKTTTLKILMGLVFPDAGEAAVLGRPLADAGWRQRVGYLPEHPYLYDYLTPREYLDYAGRLFGLPASVRRERTDALLARVGLAHVADLAMRRFSKGMVQRAGVAQALINDPEMVFLDEPMSGLDPVGRRLVRDLILELKGRGKTVFFSTHILSDAETLCDRVAVLRGGELLSAGRLDDILRIDAEHLEVLASGLRAPALLERLPDVRARHAVGERWRLEVAAARLGEVVQAIQADGGRILSVQPIRQSLEEYFFREMGPVAPAESGVLGD
jgi:ABC-2 type transport system ATP-binding protein